MENGNNAPKEPQDSVRKNDNKQNESKNQNNLEEKIPQDNITNRQKLIEENINRIISDEEGQKIKKESIVQEVVQEKSNQIINFSNELESILASLNVIWEKNRDGFENYYQTEIIPKITELLDYPCITSFQEKIFLIFRFLCKYFFSRKNYLKEIPFTEIVEIIIILYNQVNLFSKTPNNVNIQNCELIDDRFFYQIFKELLPNKEVENTFSNSDKNCMYKYFVEFLFQSGFTDSFVDDILTRNDLSAGSFAQVSFAPFYILNFCDKEYLMKKNYNIKMMKNYNSKIDFFLSDKNPNIKNFDDMIKFGNLTINFYIDTLFGMFNHILDEIKADYYLDCQIFCINGFKICEYLLKQQKINIRIGGIHLASLICDNYRNIVNNIQFFNKKYNDIDKIYPLAVNCAIHYLNKINIFDLIFGENIHEGVIQRAYSVISFLYRNKSFSSLQIEKLWHLSQTKYQSISNSIIELFGKLLPEFSNEDCNRILNVVSKMNFKQVNETTLKLLENFFIGNEKRELLLNILFIFSNELSSEKGLDKNIINKSREILVKLLFNNNYIDDLIKYIKDCIFYINNFYLIDTYLSTLTQILDEFDRNKNLANHNKLKEIYIKFDKRINDFGIMISYLDQNYKLFPILFNSLIKIIKLFKYYYFSSINIIDQISKGNFEYESLLNIDNLYNSYKNYINNNMNLSLNLNETNGEGDMDIEYEGNKNKILNINKKEKITINDKEYDNYIKNIIKDFIKFFKETFLASNVLPSSDEVKRDIFLKLKLFSNKYNYNDNITNYLRVIFNNHLRSNIPFKINYLNFLFQIGQNTKDIDSSIEWYYNLLYDLFSKQILSNHKLNLLKDENLEYLLKNQVINCDYKILPISAFKIVDIFCIYANTEKKYAEYSPIIKKYTKINDIKSFYKFELFWNFFSQTRNETIYNQALNILLNILELSSQNTESRNYFNSVIFNFIEKNKNSLQNNQEIKIAFIRNLKLISVLNGAKISKNLFDNNNNNSSIEIIIKNFYFTSKESSENISKIKISKDIKIRYLKENLINEIICTPNNLRLYNQIITSNNNYILSQQNNMTDGEISTSSGHNNMKLEETISNIEDFKKAIYKTNIIINYKTNVLKDEYSLSDYNVEKNANLVILKGSGYTEEEYKPSEEEFKACYDAIKTIFGDNLYFDVEVMKESVIKHRGNAEDAALYLTDPENVKTLQKEIEEKKKRVPQNNDEIMYLEQNIIDLLIEVLENNNNDIEISQNIWLLFSEIKFPDDLINKIVGEQFENILNADSINSMILYLKILNSIIFGDDFCKYNKLRKEEKNKWISIFIKNENIISRLFLILSTINEKMDNQRQIYQILNIFMNWFHKILLKIDNLLNSENGNNLIGVKLLKQFNSQNNININDNNSLDNKKENEEKKSEDFEIINKDDAIKFMIILFNVNGIDGFYKILNIMLNLKTKEEDKIIIIENIFEIFITYLTLQTNSISQISNIEKNCNVLINIICNGKDKIIPIITKNFIKTLLNDTFSFIDKREYDKESSLFNVFCLSFMEKIMKGCPFNDQFCELFGTLLVIQTNKLVRNSIDPLISKILNDAYNLCSNLKTNDFSCKKTIVYEIYIIYCLVKFYKDNLKIYINKMLSEEKKDFLELIFSCLFEISRDNNKINSYKFSEEFLRKHSFDLITQLITSDENFFNKILPKVLTHHKKLIKTDQNKNQIPFDVNLRSPKEKFVGLRNFGCTCYLNSLFQQIFMIPTFRYDLLDKFLIKGNNGEEYKYSVIYNMQITFQNLIAGLMSPYPPSRFIRSFTSAFNGQPIQLGIMQDSDEFLSILCDNLEKEAKTFGLENFLENSFKGKISNEILSQEVEYPYYSQSEEPFYRITLDIKEHKTLEEALDAYIKGEILEGDNKYYVEEYKKKISIRKSCSLKKLGNEVIIHLKRFEYDFITFTNKKLNDYIKFPKVINFKKWTRAFLRLRDNNISKNSLNLAKEEEGNLIDENMDYILTGILIHGGSNLESGHYYSFIMDQETGMWHQYNDNIISDYNIETDLEKECFGNLPENKDQYGKTAYLLFYTKKKCFKNKNLFEKINANEYILNDVYNENVNFLNMNLFTNFNYFKFLKEFSNFGSSLLEDYMYNDDQKRITMNSNLRKEENIYYKVLSVIKSDDDHDEDNDSVDENINEENDENIITNKENFEQIYNKCKEEVEIIMKEEKSNKNKIKKIISKKDIVKLYFNYLFGIVFPYMNNTPNLLIQGLDNLNNILKNNTGYSLWILKQIEKNVDIFTNLFFKYGTTDNEMNELNKKIIEFFQITFDAIYSYEKDISLLLLDEIKYFSKNDKGKYIIVKENKSIIMRLIKKLFCENLEKSRIEYAKSSLYLIIFYNFIKGYPEIASICSKYILTIISLISNNTLSDIISEINPNYFMGNCKTYAVNKNYIMIFSDIILRCVTPGMENTKTYSPYFTGRRTISENRNSELNIDFSKLPHLPKNWEKMLSIEFFLTFVLFDNYFKSKEIICHLCYGDEKISIKILSLVNQFIKSQSSFLPFQEKVFINTLSVFELKDALEFIRLDTLFQLNDDNNNENKEPSEIQEYNLFDFYYEVREKHINLVLYMLYNVAKAIEKYNIVCQYFEKNKNKLLWINYFLIELKSDAKMKEDFVKSNAFIMSQHPDLISAIQNSIIKRFELDSN